MHSGIGAWRPIAVAVILAAGCSGSPPASSDSWSTPIPQATQAIQSKVGPNPTVTAVSESGVKTTAPTVAAPAQERLPSADSMAAVSGGRYQLGAKQPGPYASGPVDVVIDPVYVDMYEVRNSAYRAFAAETAAESPLSWRDGRYPETEADFAVTGVSWEWANAYCVSLGKRLPSEAEWEAAVRGTDRRLYPWGDQSDRLDLNALGPAAVGSQPLNVTAIGIRDLVGGVWEWVGDPYSTVEEGYRVRRGGRNGFVREGAVMRQVVSQAELAGAAESTGFRCAAPRVDPARSPLEFDHGHAPSVRATQASLPPLAPGVLFEDTFRSKQFGWAPLSSSWGSVGYETPTNLFIESVGAGVTVVERAPLGEIPDGEVTADVALDSATPEGQFRFGILLRGSSAVSPSSSSSGSERPKEYYAFVVNPRLGRWQLVHEDIGPRRNVAEGPVPDPEGGKGFSPRLSLLARLKGSQLSLFLNGVEVGTYDTHGYHLGGSVGLYLENLTALKTRVALYRFSIANT
jgi:formylglycine-generating enzyme required for sulfatase activity